MKKINIETLKTFLNKGYEICFDNIWEEKTFEEYGTFYHYNKNSDGTISVWNPGYSESDCFEIFRTGDFLFSDLEDERREICYCSFYDEEVSYTGYFDDDFILHLEEYGFYYDNDFCFGLHDYEIYVDEIKKYIYIKSIRGDC